MFPDRATDPAAKLAITRTLEEELRQLPGVRQLAEEVVARHGSSISLNLGMYPYPDYEPMAFWGDRAKLDHSLAAA